MTQATVEEKYAELLVSYADLERKYLALTETATEPTNSTSLSYIEFRSLVVNKIGKHEGDEQGWRSAFLLGSGGKYTEGHVNKWKKSNSVPTEVIQDIEALDLSDLPTKQDWTDEEKSILHSYFVTDTDGWTKVGNGYTIASLADHLTKEFGRGITEGSIKSKLNVFRKKKKQPVDNNVVVTNFAQFEAAVAAS
jgi:hypothetical protein